MLLPITKAQFTAAIKKVSGAADGTELQTASRTYNAGIAVIQSISSWAVSFMMKRGKYAYSFLNAFLRGRSKAKDSGKDTKGSTELAVVSKESYDSIDSLFESVLESI